MSRLSRIIALTAAAISLTTAAPAMAQDLPLPGLPPLPETEAPAAPQGCANADAIPNSKNLAAMREAVVCLVNEERAERGLKALEVDSRLAAAARRHSQDMRKRRYFAHVSLSGKTDVQRAKAAGYGRFRSLGENLAWGTGRLASPRSIVRSWMESPGHRRNILFSTFRDVGVGIALGAPVKGISGGATYTADFGSI